MKRRDDLLIGPKEKAIAAIRSGNVEEAIKQIEELAGEFKPLHDRYNDWHQSLLNFISERLGEEAVEEALRRVFNDVYRESSAGMKNVSHDDLVKFVCKAHRCHQSDFYIEEDDENTYFIIPYCGSGGRLQKRGEPFGRRTGKPYPWSFNRSGVNYYCCHEAVFGALHKELGIDFLEFEYSELFDKDGNPTGGTCRAIVSKKKTVRD